MKQKAILLILGAITTSVLALPAGANATQAAVPKCTAPSGQSCVRIDNRSAAIHSARIGSESTSCIRNLAVGKTSFSGIHVKTNSIGGFFAYKGSKCEGNSIASSGAEILGPDANNYQTIVVTS